MSAIWKPVGGAALGVTIPIVIEFGAKGAKVGPVKISGVIGTILGVGEIAGAYMYSRKPGAKDEDVFTLAAMGGASLATGVSILILDELRKRALYAFRGGRGRNIPLQGNEEELARAGAQYPTSRLVEEI